MKRGLLFAVSGAAFLIAGLSGCSSSAEKPAASSSSSSSSKASSSESSSASSSAEAGGGAIKLTVDGKDQGLTGSPTCVTTGSTVNIGMGESGSAIGAMVKEDGSSVTSVALGNVDGAALAVGAGLGDATATKDGNTYTIKGNASGANLSDPLAGIITKPFELVVTCP